MHYHKYKINKFNILLKFCMLAYFLHSIEKKNEEGIMDSDGIAGGEAPPAPRRRLMMSSM